MPPKFKVGQLVVYNSGFSTTFTFINAISVYGEKQYKYNIPFLHGPQLEEYFRNPTDEEIESYYQ